MPIPTRDMDFYAASDNDIICALHNLGRSKIHCIEAGSAETRYLHAWSFEIIPGFKSGRARDNSASFADRIDAAINDIVHQASVQPIAVTQGFENMRTKANGRNLMQAAIFLALATRCADVIVNICVGHNILPVATAGSKAAGDQKLHDFVGAAINPLDASVTEHAGDWIFIHIAVATM